MFSVTSSSPVSSYSVVGLEEDIPLSLNLLSSQKLPAVPVPGIQHGDGCMDFDRAEAPDPTMENISMSGFLANLGLDHLLDIFEKEQVCTYLEHICLCINIYFP